MALMNINTMLMLILCMFVCGGVCVGRSVCCCCLISVPVPSFAAHLSISNGTTIAAEPATTPQLSHRKYTKSHFFMCKSVCRLEMLVCCMFVDQHVHLEPQFVFPNPGLLRSKCRMTNFRTSSLNIKHTFSSVPICYKRS